MEMEWCDKPRMHCPSCGAHIEFLVTCKQATLVDSTRESLATGTAPQSTRHGTTAEHDVIAAARRAGLLEPFAQVVAFVKRDQVPKDLEGFFITFVRGLTPRLIPRYALDAFNALFDHAPLEYHSNQGIGVVVINGSLRMFVPNTVLVGTRLRALNRNSGGSLKRTLKIDDSEAQLREWIHTRWGYVAGTGALLDQLYTRSIGEFARPNLSAPGAHRT
jgi:hypothetical protein